MKYDKKMHISNLCTGGRRCQKKCDSAVGSSSIFTRIINVWTKDSIAKTHTLATLLFAYSLPKNLKFCLMEKTDMRKRVCGIYQSDTFNLQILKHKDTSLQLGNEELNLILIKILIINIFCKYICI